jgi:hypothetical protein
MQIMGCTLSYHKHKALVDVQTKQMISPSGLNTKNKSIWSPWEPEFQSYSTIMSTGMANTSITYNIFSAQVSLVSALNLLPLLSNDEIRAM